MLHPIAIGLERRTIDGAIDHLEHAASVIGVERVCLGGDFTRRLWEAMPPPPEPKDGLAPPGVMPGMGIEGLVGPQDYPALVAGLEARGWAESDVAAVTSGNLLALPAVEPLTPRLELPPDHSSTVARVSAPRYSASITRACATASARPSKAGASPRPRQRGSRAASV